jgi:hypothetical protein
MGNFLVPKDMNDASRKTIHTRLADSGFNAQCIWKVAVHLQTVLEVMSITSCKRVSFSRRTLLHGSSIQVYDFNQNPKCVEKLVAKRFNIKFHEHLLGDPPDVTCTLTDIAK